MNVCTIIAQNYVAHARVLARSLAQTHPGSRLWTLVIDDFSRRIDPAQEPFTILTPSDVGCEDFTSMALRYSVLELSTAVKPWLLGHLLRETGGPVSYLDPDIKIYGSLEELDQLAASHGVVLTPHNLKPIPQDGRRPSQVDVMIAGIYNLGCVSLAPRPEVDRLLAWWSERLLRDCRVDPIWGYFVDQRWFDLVPGFQSDLAIVRDPEYNVAYWNLHERRLERQRGRYEVDGRPLSFFHFSGFDPQHPLILSRHQDRIDVTEHPALEQLLTDYAAEVMNEGHAVSRHWPYAYGALGDGTPLDATLRSLYDEFTDELAGRGGKAPSPFELEGIRVFDDWLGAQVPGAFPGINRVLLRVYQDRPDLRAAYPDLSGTGGAGLLTWAHEYGHQEVPLLTRGMSDTNGPASVDADAACGDTASAARREPAQPLREAPWGVNVIGHFDSELESGNAARAVIGALDAKAIPGVPIQSHESRGGRDDHPFLTVPVADAPFPVNLLCLDGGELRDFVREAGRQAFSGRYSVGLWFWELSVLPDNWRLSLALLEEVWAPSAHVAQALARVATVPVTTVRLPVEGRGLAILSRAQVGMPEDKFVFLFSFDYSDGVRRKNPFALVEAFRAAARPGDGAELVLRCAGGAHRPEAHAELREACAHPGITVIDRDMSPAEEGTLTALCDCFVSLHRAEAFGYALAEAMWHGKPVIATGYSGNLDFMTRGNSFLVDHHLVPIGPGAEPYPADGEWAEPNVQHAAERIREVLDDRAEARRLGAKAAREIRATHSPAVAGEVMARRLESIRATGRARTAPNDALKLSPAVARMSLPVRQVASRRAAPGRGHRLRELARQGVLRLMRPVTTGQQAINEVFIAALTELDRSIADLRREHAAERAGVLAQLRRYERLAPIIDAGFPDPEDRPQRGTPDCDRD